MNISKTALALGLLGTSVLVLTGCGSKGATNSNASANKSLDTSNATSTASSNGQATNSPSNSQTSNEAQSSSNSTGSTGSANEISNSSSSGNTRPVYVFNQPILKAMYAILRAQSVGPIEPPQNLVKETGKWKSKVSLKMLNYAPKQERQLDKQLITSIRSSKGIPLLKELPGYKLKHYKTPTSSGAYWWPMNNQWPKWVSPTKH
ncbi:hypothetical protein [Alicyclobacillus sp. SO9]|uniref:hypothetical protein n=1 Tax=Alicyclobacillus sp. SO9 TaxID=2665646 RepID=UPI0018E85839|nr:hypothetical protein [Alicyclobacillus sp. SO9]QQE78790.1 hypothetical protein GI364_23590 [Alicyclobacillus sp. SO9]